MDYRLIHSLTGEEIPPGGLLPTGNGWGATPATYAGILEAPSNRSMYGMILVQAEGRGYATAVEPVDRRTHLVPARRLP